MQLDLQIATESQPVPSLKVFEGWMLAALKHLNHPCDVELTIRLVDSTEITQLNRDYRGKDKATNVLSFPFEPYDALIAYAGDVAEIAFLGDIVMASAVIEAEAKAQNKPLMHHYAHMCIHGLLHLLGYDHIEEEQAQVMENLEIEILSHLAIDNPYREK